MLSLTTPTPLSFSSTTSISPLPFTSLTFPTKTPSKLISAAQSNPPPSLPRIIIPNSSSYSAQPQNLYQPYRPPQNPLPAKYKSLDTPAIIEVLSNRLGLWFEYAPLIEVLFRDGFTHPTIEELTGITGVEQNRLIVAAQVRQSIAETPYIEAETLAFFDSGGSEILYELRLLNEDQRAATATYIVNNRLDGEKARDIARAIKDFPSRREIVPGWDRFDYYKPGDMWSFTFFRQSREFTTLPEKRMSLLTTALEVAETETAKARIQEEMERGKEAVEEEVQKVRVRVPVVRLQYGEVAEATSVVTLPVCEAEERQDGVLRAPYECRSEGEFGVVVSDKSWDKWVVLPKWIPLAGMGPGGVVVAFPHAKALPWRVKGTYEEEPVLLVANREKSEVVEDDGFYLVGEGAQGELKMVRGLVLKEMGKKESLGMVILVIRPPRDEADDQLNDEDWD